MSKQVHRRDVLRVIGLTASGAILVACGATPETPPGAGAASGAAQGLVTPQGRTLPADAAPLDRQVFYSNADEPKHLDVSRDIYAASAALNWGTEPLLRRDENQKIVPALAESYTVGPNAEYFDFVIRKDAKWSDGQPITADDFVFTFRHIADPNLDNPWTWFFYDIKGIKALKEAQGKPEDVGVEAIDPRTVRIYSESGPAPHIPALLAYQAAVPAPKHLAEKNPEHWADTVEGFVSSGPFKLTKWDHNQRMEWEINPNYNGPHTPAVQKVIVLLGAPSTGWFNSWLNKEIDLIAGLQPQEVEQVKADPELAKLLHAYNNFQTEYLAFDTMSAPLDNKTLRQALCHAIDRDTLCTSVMNGTRVPAYSMLPPNFPGYNAELKNVQTYDVEKAKALLVEAGYPDGKDSSGKQLTLELFSNGREAVMEFVKDQWERNLGISVNLQVLENAVWGQRRAEHAMQIYKGPYEYDYLDPANLLTSLWRSTDDKGSPRHSWKNEQFDDLVTRAGREVDDAKRIALYQDAEKLLVEEAPAAFLTHQVIFQTWWPYIAGIPADTTGNVVFRGLDISRFQMYIRNDENTLRQPH